MDIYLLPCRTLSLLFVASLASAQLAPAQTVGGRSELLYQWDGNEYLGSLGQSVSGAGDVNGDGVDDVFVGAPGQSAGGVAVCGGAVVLSGIDGTVIHQWFGGFTYQNFGFCVSGAGDVNADGFADLIVGADFHNYSSPMGAGSVYVYSGFSGLLLYHWEGAAAYDYLGRSVSGAGDINADGYDDLIVGAATANPGGLLVAGSAFAYSGIDGSILYQWDGATPLERFGYCVSDAGDVNADGFADVIIGPEYSSPAGLQNAGSAFVYSGSNGALLYQWNGEEEGDLFGNSVSGAGDFNKDGFDDLIVGAMYADPGGLAYAGSAYVFSGADGSQLQRWHGEEVGDAFGFSVAEAGDVNQDGFSDVIIGAFEGDFQGLPGIGSVHLYSGASGIRLHRWNGLTSDDHFGEAVAGAGDLNGDGIPDLIVGAYHVSLGGLPNSGSAYVYSFEAFLRSDSPTISAAVGGAIQLHMNFPSSAASYAYKVLISSTGTGPSSYGVPIPLTRDSLVDQTFSGNYPFANYSNLQGILNSTGDATASITLPPGLPLGLIGRTFWFAAIANQPGQIPEFSSVAVPIEITP